MISKMSRDFRNEKNKTWWQRLCLRFISFHPEFLWCRQNGDLHGNTYSLVPERRGTTGASSNPVSAFCFEHVGIVDPDFDVEAPVVPRRTQLVLLRMPGGNDIVTYRSFHSIPLQRILQNYHQWVPAKYEHDCQSTGRGTFHLPTTNNSAN